MSAYTGRYHKQIRFFRLNVRAAQGKVELSGGGSPMMPCARMTFSVACLCALIGCGRSPAPSAQAEQHTLPLGANALEEEKVANPQTVVPVSVNNEQQDRGAIQFSPPFPERLEMFLPLEHTQSAARSSEEPNEMVELKGFITVDQPLAILSIDGVITTVSEGSEKYGVRVMAIQPPSVTYQRGRNRRTVSLK